MPILPRRDASVHFGRYSIGQEAELAWELSTYIRWVPRIKMVTHRNTNRAGG